MQGVVGAPLALPSCEKPTTPLKASKETAKTPITFLENPKSVDFAWPLVVICCLGIT
jgi:hypothetical protein